MRDAIETVMFWLVMATGSSGLIALLLFLIHCFVHQSFVYLGIIHDYIDFLAKRRREGRT